MPHRTHVLQLLAPLAASGALALGLAVALPAHADTPASSTTASTPAAPVAAKPGPAAPHQPPTTLTEAEKSLWHTEEGFAASFAARDPEKFASFLDEHAVFMGRRMLRGKKEIAEAWGKMMTAGPAAPFSWRPSRSMVSGDVGTTSGPVYDLQGKYTGSFTSVWKRQPDGTWRIILDGAAPCEEPREETPAGG